MMATKSYPPAGLTKAHEYEETLAQFNPGLSCVCNVEAIPCGEEWPAIVGLKTDGPAVTNIWGNPQGQLRGPFTWDDTILKNLGMFFNCTPDGLELCHDGFGIIWHQMLRPLGHHELVQQYLLWMPALNKWQWEH